MRRLARHLMTMLALLSLLLCTALCVVGVNERYPVRVGGLLVLPIAWIAAMFAWAWHCGWQRRTLLRRVAAGQCGFCGYDLRASSGCCPECGRIPDAVHSGPPPVPR